MSEIEPDECLSRYILSKSHIRQDGTVRHNALMPWKHDNCTSVFRITGLSESEKWDLGEREIATRQGKPLIGSAEIKAIHVYKNNLEIDPDDNPPRHANITGWPEDKSKIRSIAQELAAQADFYFKMP